MRLLEKICKELGVKVGEEWLGSDGNKFIISGEGRLIRICESGHTFNADSWIPKILTGELKPVWKPEKGEKYYFPRPDLTNGWNGNIWTDTTNDNHRVNKGLAFKTKEEAIECTNKILETTKGW